MTQFDKGTVHLTTHRILYINSASPKEFSLEFNLSNVKNIQITVSFPEFCLRNTFFWSLGKVGTNVMAFIGSLALSRPQGKLSLNFKSVKQLRRPQNFLQHHHRQTITSPNPLFAAIGPVSSAKNPIRILINATNVV